MDRRLTARVAALWLVIFMLASAINAVYATKYDYGNAQATSTVQTPTVQLQSGTMGSSSVSNGVYATVTVTSSAIPLYYVPVTLTNCATCSATPSTFQVLIEPNPSSYSTYEASDLGNVRFCSNTACGTELYSWLEGCGSSAPYGPCSTTSTSANFWVKLTSPIAGSGGTLTIYMVFLSTSTEFDGIYGGEAPQLSTTYAAYDNGAHVFDIYFNGNTAVASFNAGTDNTVAQATDANPISGGSTINVIDLTGYGASNRVNMILTTPLPAGNPSYGEIAESYSEIQAGKGTGGGYLYQNAQGLAGFCDSTVTSSTTINAESEMVGYSATLYGYVYVADGAATPESGGGADAATTWYYAALAYPGTSSTSFSGIVSQTFYAAYAASTPYHPITSSTQLYWCSVGASVPGNPDGLYFNWGRARAYPPPNSQGVPTMPSASFGSVTSAAKGVILTFANSGSSSWLANLAVVTSTNAARLKNLTLSFQSPYSKQVIFGTGVTNQTSGPQVTLAASSSIAIMMGVTVSSAGTSTVTLGLKIQYPPASGVTSVYCYDVISLTVN